MRSEQIQGANSGAKSSRDVCKFRKGEIQKGEIQEGEIQEGKIQEGRKYGRGWSNSQSEGG